jgi:sulfatase modifying factor 1
MGKGRAMNVRMMAVAGLVLAAGGAAMADKITIETVPVGNPGNAYDPEWSWPGYEWGAVAYEYNIGKYEVTAGQYAAFLNAVGGVDAYSLYNTTYMWRTDYGSGIERRGGGTVGDPYTYTVATAFANRPVNFVSWGDAARFANWLQNEQRAGAQDSTTTEDGAYYLNGATSDADLLAVSRKADWKWAITGENEWYKAAYYNPATATYYDFPTSSDTEPGQDMADASGNNANQHTAGFPYPIDSGMYTTLVGEFQNSESPYGTFDQGGNVWEWNESILSDYDGTKRGIRGGAWNDDYSLLFAAMRYSYLPTHETSIVGFRVSEVSVIPEPVSMTILALGGVGMVLRRRGLRG